MLRQFATLAKLALTLSLSSKRTDLRSWLAPKLDGVVVAWCCPSNNWRV
jgi:hypothetical protein